MLRFIAVILAAALLAGTAQAMAAETDQRTCALTRAFDCTPEDGCTEASLQAMALPRFVRIDLKSKVITSLDREVQRSTKIENSVNQKDVIVMQGTELRGWSMTLCKETGGLSLSASGDGEGFVVFGNCLNQ